MLEFGEESLVEFVEETLESLEHEISIVITREFLKLFFEESAKKFLVML